MRRPAFQSIPEAYRKLGTIASHKYPLILVIQYGTMTGIEVSRKEMSREEILTAGGYALPVLPSSGGNYIPAKTVGKLVYLAGVISTDADGIIAAACNEAPNVEVGYIAAQRCALTQLAVLKQHLGSLESIKNIVSVSGYVTAPAGFPDAPRIINGASDLLVEVFGDAGRHVRAAIGVSSLPRNALVELQMVVEIE